LQGIVGSVKRVTDIVGEIAAASGEQSIGIEQVNTAMTQMDHVTQSNSAETEELSSTAQLLSVQSARLLELVGTFTLGDRRETARGERGHESSVQSRRHSAGAARRPGTSATKAATGKLASSAPNGRKQVNQSAVLVSTSAARSDDASFEEF
jgi:hypothetical protein